MNTKERKHTEQMKPKEGTHISVFSRLSTRDQWTRVRYCGFAFISVYQRRLAVRFLGPRGTLITLVAAGTLCEISPVFYQQPFSMSFGQATLWVHFNAFI